MSGKKYSDASERLDRQKFYDPNEALGLVKELASANFKAVKPNHRKS